MSCYRVAMLAIALSAAPAAALEAPPLAGKSIFQFEWNARLRHEAIDDDGFASSADATTLRMRAGIRAGFAHGLSAFVEGEGIAAAGSHNNGASGRTDYPAVIDPDGVELNQALLAWMGEGAGAILGRQRILIDNQRWLGNSRWRQNEQTFDALSVDWRASPSLTGRYAWIDRVHRINGDDALDPLSREREFATHLVNVAWKLDAHQLVGYAYLHRDRNVPSASTATYGLRWTGSQLRRGDGWGWTLEAAHQREHSDNPSSFAHAYWLIEPTLAWRGVTWRAGWEHLGGDGVHSLQAPLGTLHAFNGWADKFLVTPPGGLDDYWVGAGGKFGRGAHADKFNWNIAWHDFRADVGEHYGTEWNASLAFPVSRSVTGLVKIAEYNSRGFARDGTKLWMQIEWVR